MTIDLGGVFVPTVTPFDPDSGELDLDAHRFNLGRWLEHPVRGVVIGGSTGEAVLLEREERLALVEATRDALDSGRLLVAGTGAESTRGTLRLTRDAAGAGADAALVQPPAYYKGAMSVEVLRDHYVAVADASPIPIILYQVPLRFSTLELATELVAELSEHPNIVGVKDSRGSLDLLAEYVTRSERGFEVLVGNGAKLLDSLEIGAVGGILGVANLLPGACARLVADFRSGEKEEAARAQEEVAPAHEVIVGGMGVPGVKRALDLLGYRGGNPRSPLRALPSEFDARIRGVLPGLAVSIS